MKRFVYLILLIVILSTFGYTPIKGYLVWRDLRGDFNPNSVKTITVWNQSTRVSSFSNEEKELILKTLRKSWFTKFNPGLPAGPTPSSGIVVTFTNGTIINVNEWGPGRFEVGLSGGKQLFIKSPELSEAVKIIINKGKR